MNKKYFLIGGIVAIVVVGAAIFFWGSSSQSNPPQEVSINSTTTPSTTSPEPNPNPTPNPTSTPAAAGTIPSTFFAISENSAGSPWPPTDSKGQIVPIGGLRLWDDGVKWGQIETGNAAYNWTGLDAWVGKAESANMDVLYTIGDTPTWAASAGNSSVCSSPNTGGCLPPADVNSDGSGTDSDLKTFMTALVTRYKGKIKYYELWNEPDAKNFYSGTPVQFARMMQDEASIIRSIDPTAKILSPSFHGPSASTWFVGFLTTQYNGKGGAADFDIVNFHARAPGGQNIEPESVITEINSAMAVINNPTYGIKGLPLWNDEAGWLINQVTDPDAQAAYVARQYILNASLGIGRFYWYNWDAKQNNGIQGTIAGTAYHQMINWLVGGTVSPCTTSGTIYSCTLTKSDGSKDLILWDTSKTCGSGVCGTASMTVATQYTTYRDIAGDAPVSITNNSVPVGAKPILLSSSN